MKILLSSDLHDITTYHQKLEEIYKQEECNLLIIPGDVLDRYKECGLLEQMLRFRHWTKNLMAKQIPLILACGNHDHNTPEFLCQESKPNNLTEEIYPKNEVEEINLIIAHPQWMSQLSQPLLQTPGENRIHTQKNHKLLITSLKYAQKKSKAILQKNEKTMADALSQKKPNQTWIVVAHQPPPTNRFCPPKLASTHNEKLIRTYQPDFFLCGHYHPETPTRTSPLTQIGQTTIINAGQTKTGKGPYYAILNLEENYLIWNQRGNQKKILLTKSNIPSQKPKKKIIDVPSINKKTSTITT